MAVVQRQLEWVGHIIFTSLPSPFHSLREMDIFFNLMCEMVSNKASVYASTPSPWIFLVGILELLWIASGESSRRLDKQQTSLPSRNSARKPLFPEQILSLVTSVLELTSKLSAWAERLQGSSCSGDFRQQEPKLTIYYTRTQRWVSYLLPICINGTQFQREAMG